MFDWWNTISLFVVDILLGWLLLLPSDVAIVAVAVLSAVLLTLIRRYSTNQDLLGRIAYDKKRLRELSRLAPDKPTRWRFQTTRSQVMLKALQAELRPLLISLLPIGLLATWCIYRLEFEPPGGDEPITVAVETPASKIGLPIHLVPQEGLQADGWIREVQSEKIGDSAVGLAAWSVRAEASDKPYVLLFRLDKRSYGHPLLVGQPRYAIPVDVHSDEVVTSVELRPIRLFGVVPGIEFLAFPAWLVAYLLLTIPLALIVKRVTGTW